MARRILRSCRGLVVRSTHLESTYLGFDPSKVLLEYVQFLRTQNDEAEAKRMQILANMWQANNMAGYLRSLQRKATVR
jgi:hypothetical protein